MPRPTNPNVPCWIKQYAAGDGLRAIGARYGVSAAAVRNALIKAGVKLRSAGKPAGKYLGVKAPTSAWHALAIAARERGETLAAIARQWGVAPQTVHWATKSARAQ